MKKNPFPFVEVAWLDACSKGGWMPLEVAKEAGLFSANTGGFLIEKNKKVVIIAQTYSGDTDQVTDLMVIPTGWVTKIKVIRK